MKTLMKNHKITMIYLKHIPSVMFFLMWIHMMFAISGWILVITNSIVGCSILPLILIFVLSDMLINIHRYTNAIQIILNLKFVMVLIGVVLVLTLLIKLKFNRI